jgi:hypothetical protein
VHSAESADNSFAAKGSRCDSPRFSEAAKIRSIVLVKASLSLLELPDGGSIATISVSACPSSGPAATGTSKLSEACILEENRTPGEKSC